MAMTKTTTLVEIRVLNASSDSPTVLLTEEITIDDADDDQLPLTTKSRRSIPKETENADGDMEATDVSGESSMVQSVCSAVWPTPSE